MREVRELAEARAAWRNQPAEEAPMDVQQPRGRRMRELYLSTRSEILYSIGAALFFAGVVAWRFAPEGNRLALTGCGAVAAWAGVTLWRFRDSIRGNRPHPDALARTGVEHYRAELQRRRDHLRSAWIWHGPLWLAGIVAAAALAGRILPGRLWSALPLVLLLAAWTAFDTRRRLRQAAELQRDIDETSRVSSIER